MRCSVVAPFLSLSFPFGSREDPSVVSSPSQVAVVVALGGLACSHGARNLGVTWRPPRGDGEGRGTLVTRPLATLRSLEREVVRASERPDTDECVLAFTSCQQGPAGHQFLVMTTSDQLRACMMPYCGNGIDDLLKISWGREVPRMALQQSGVLVRGREGDVHESKLEAAIEKLTSAKDRPGLVILEARCEDPVDTTLRTIALLNQAKMSVLLTMFRHAPDRACDDPRFRTEQKLD
jgi:hypothetical protein